MATKLIKIQVNKLDKLHVGDFKEIFRQSVEVDCNVDFDYQLIEKSLRILFLRSTIQFSVF